MSNRLDNIKKMIASPEVKLVSFDMFDTLITRPCINPQDIFTLIESKYKIPFFKQRRVAAESRARLLKDFDKQEITIDEIYDNYKTMFTISESEREELKQSEMEMEIEIVQSRKSVKKLYNYAKMKGKKIIITSDMYLPKDHLQKMLVRAEYDDNLIIYVSSEYNATKRSGSLYEHIITEMDNEGILTKNILHIGDNSTSDIEVANRYGISTVHIPKTIDVFYSCARLSRITQWQMPVYNGNSALLIGLYANMVFDDPFVDFDKDSRFNGNSRLLGLYHGPFFVLFCLWMIREMDKDKIDYLIYVWRDGFLIEKILEIFDINLPNKIPESKRIHLSRAMRYPFYALKAGGLFDSLQQWVLDPNTSLLQFIDKYLMIKEEEDKQHALAVFAKHGYTSKYQAMGKPDNYLWFIHEFDDLFKKGSSNHIELVKEDVESIGARGKKVGIYDIGYRGTVSRFLSEFFEIDSNTYHALGTMGLHDEIDGSEIKAFIEYGKSNISNTHNKLNQYLEVISCDQNPGVVGVKQTENCGYEYIYDEGFEESEEIKGIQSGIIEYAKSFNNVFGRYISCFSGDPQIFWTMILALLSAPNEKDALFLKNIKHSMSYFSGNITDFSQWFNKTVPNANSNSKK
ncbi:MAG: HAD family hydrolase [Suipraeoptans sp.]